jgi:integrase
MRIYDPQGNRLYLNAAERQAFLAAAGEEGPQERVFCHVLYYTGCRPSEALELTARRIFVDERAILIRSLKKRAFHNDGSPKEPEYRTVDVPEVLIEDIDLVFDVRTRTRMRKGKVFNKPLWEMSRVQAWRLVKWVMARAGIHGKQATAKGLRHGFGIAMLQASVPLHIVSELLGHADSKTTEIYLKAVGLDRRNLVMRAWN